MLNVYDVILTGIACEASVTEDNSADKLGVRMDMCDT